MALNRKARAAREARGGKCAFPDCEDTAKFNSVTCDAHGLAYFEKMHREYCAEYVARVARKRLRLHLDANNEAIPT